MSPAAPVPTAVLVAATRTQDPVPIGCATTLIGGASEAATAGVSRLRVRVRSGAGEQVLDIVAKRLRPVTTGRHAAVANDPCSLGVGPVGADLAHLALSVLEDLVEDYLAGWHGDIDPDLVRLGYRTTLTLTGASRLRWMRRNGIDVPDGYEPFVT